MTYLLSTYWLWMLLALVLGGIVGFTSFLRSASGWWPQSWPGWFKLLCVLFVVGVVVAVLQWLPGLAGHYLETALLFVGSYIVGCFLGSWLASLRATQPLVADNKVAAASTGASTSIPVSPKPVPLAPASAASPPVSASVAPGPVSGEHEHPGKRPPAAARASIVPDDLKRISGIGHVNEEKLNELGIWTFSQIAAWTHENAQWVGSYMAFPGRIEREDWIGQAGQLAKGLETEFSRRVERGEVPTSSDNSASSSAANSSATTAPPPLASVSQSTTEVAAGTSPPTVSPIGNDGHPGRRPPSVAKPSVAPDNLKRISGIGHVNEEKLNELGIWTFRQVAAWTHENAEWVGSYMAFPGRIEREDWIGQAGKLAQGIETEFSRRVDLGDVPTSS
jgi:predicted flap endonuclease-1-like 5' DNA nuclease